MQPAIQVHKVLLPVQYPEQQSALRHSPLSVWTGGLSRFLPPLLYKLTSPARQRSLLATTVALALTANVASSLAIYPHTLSYFNELVGGPLNGTAHLLDGNIEWGQDLLFLRDWYAAHPDAVVSRRDHFGLFSPPIIVSLRELRSRRQSSNLGGENATSNQKMWTIVGTTELTGYARTDCAPDPLVALRTIPPYARVGYSLYVFSDEDAGASRAGSDHQSNRN